MNGTSNQESETLQGHKPNHQPYLTVKELAERWKCCEESIRRDVRARKLKSVYRYGRHLISMDVIILLEAESTMPVY
jgi:hypothetical protein